MYVRTELSRNEIRFANWSEVNSGQGRKLHASFEEAGVTLLEVLLREWWRVVKRMESEMRWGEKKCDEESKNVIGRRKSVEKKRDWCRNMTCIHVLCVCVCQCVCMCISMCMYIYMLPGWTLSPQCRQGRCSLSHTLRTPWLSSSTPNASSLP